MRAPPQFGRLRRGSHGRGLRAPPRVQLRARVRQAGLRGRRRAPRGLGAGCAPAGLRRGRARRARRTLRRRRGRLRTRAGTVQWRHGLASIHFPCSMLFQAQTRQQLPVS